MAKYRIAVLPGDGVGNDVMEATMLVLKSMNIDAEYIYGDVGWEFWKSEGNPLPDRTMELMKQTDACLFGAITSKPKEEAQKELAPELQGKGLTYFSPIVRMRQELDLYINLRPCKAYPGNPLNFRDDIDLVVFRENTEGMYAGVEYFPVPQDLREKMLEHNKKMERFMNLPPNELAITARLITKKGSERIVRAAFEYAKEHNRKSVTVVEKPNVLRETSGLFVRTAREVAKDYPGIELWETNIDAQAMWMVKNPQDYDVLVMSNLFGDIISDLGAQLVGGLGFSPSGNIGKDYGVFEPTHGSAPKYAGQYKVNPTAMLLAAKLMLDFLGEKEQAERLERGIAKTIAEKKVRTYDMGGSNTTMEMAEEVIRNMD